MTPRGVLRTAVQAVDRRIADAAVRRGFESPALLAFVFHGLFEDKRAAHAGAIDPFQPLTTDELGRFVDYFVSHGYRFVTPAEIAAGLDAAGRYLWLTFDDGYANNVLALDALHRYGVPATFFVSTNHVIEGKCFWWDVLYRERRRRGVAVEEIARETAVRQLLPFAEIEAFVRAEFGADALRPVGDVDRPMTVAELRDFAADPLVTIGSHAADHATLTTLADTAVREQIASSQTALREMTGAAAVAIAYPHGVYDGRIMRLVRESGLPLAAVVEPRKNHLPLTPEARMSIARYLLGTGLRPLDDDCAVCRSDLQLINLSRRLRSR